MQVHNIQKTDKQFAFRIESINFAPDGSTYVSYQLGFLAEDSVFTVVGNKSFGLTADESAQILLEETPLRQKVEALLSEALRSRSDYTM